MFNISWWQALNKIGNFSVLLAAGWFIARNYLYPSIKQIMERKALAIVALEQDLVATAQQNRDIVEAIKAQEAYAANLLIKIKTWKNALAISNEQRDAHMSVLEKNCLLYLQKRADGLCQERLKQAVFPHVFTKTREEVVAFFQDKAAHESYIKSLIAGLPKRKSA